jgi:hypothetical protein
MVSGASNILILSRHQLLFLDNLDVSRHYSVNSPILSFFGTPGSHRHVTHRAPPGSAPRSPRWVRRVAAPQRPAKWPRPPPGWPSEPRPGPLWDFLRFFFPHLVFLWFSQTSGFLKFSDFEFFFDFWDFPFFFRFSGLGDEHEQWEFSGILENQTPQTWKWVTINIRDWMG